MIVILELIELANIIISCKDDYVVSYDDADELVVYDMDERKLIDRFKKPRNIHILEDLLEKYDPWALITESLSPEKTEVVRDMGIKIHYVNKRRVEEVIKEILG